MGALVGLLFWLGCVAEARPITSADIVKVYSRQVSTNVWREGSGVLVAGRDSPLVVTSFHVAYGLGEANYETYVLRGAEKIAATWVASEWAKGVMLFRLEGSPEGLLSLADLTTKPFLGARALGFPHGQTELYDVEGELRGLNYSALFFDLPKMLEAEGIETELGMSGGALVSDAGDFLGILSHQKRSATGVTTFAIPGAALKEWLEAVESGAFRPRFLVENHNIDNDELILHGSGWTIMAEPGHLDGMAKVYLRVGPHREGFEEITELTALAEQMRETAMAMRSSLPPEEKGTLNSFYLWAGFRSRGAPYSDPASTKLESNAVEFLRRFLHYREDVYFVNSGVVNNFLESKWMDIFTAWEAERNYYLEQLGPSVHYTLDRLAAFERERYQHLYGLNCFFAIFTPAEIQEMLFKSPLDQRWAELKAKNPSLHDRFRDPIDRALELMRRANFVYRRP